MSLALRHKARGRRCFQQWLTKGKKEKK
jgi:hypothetical protein